MSGGHLVGIALYLAAGAALGVVYFLLLARSVALHTGGAGVLRVAPLYVARIAAAVAVFWAIAQQGALPLLAALLGFLAARLAVQRWWSART